MEKLARKKRRFLPIRYSKKVLAERRWLFIGLAIAVILLIAGAVVWRVYSDYKKESTDETADSSATGPNDMGITVQASDVDQDVVSANNSFGLSIFSEIVGSDTNGNVFISPSSIQFALAMVYNGADGETKAEMAEVLGLADMDLEAVNQGNSDLLSYLENADPQAQLAIANSLWAAQGVELSSEFQTDMESYYGAEISNVDFGSQEGIDTINSWVSEKTREKITTILDQPNSSIVLALLNAIYFKGTWTIEFDEADTTSQPFTLSSGEETDVLMMSQSGSYDYYENDDFQAISLPYGEGTISMYVFLPKTDSNIAEFYAGLDVDNWEEWMIEFSEKEGDIALPKFKVEYKLTLNNALKALGMETAFAQGADFGNMFVTGNSPWIDEVIHKTFVEVNEEGTEAAAVTAVTMLESSPLPDDTFSMVVDHPFFFSIRDNGTGTILFMGSITDPQ